MIHLRDKTVFIFQLLYLPRKTCLCISRISFPPFFIHWYYCMLISATWKSMLKIFLINFVQKYYELLEYGFLVENRKSYLQKSGPVSDIFQLLNPCLFSLSFWEENSNGIYSFERFSFVDWKENALNPSQ